VIEFTLDGQTVHAPEGELLVHAAARNGVFIPTLCHDDKLAPYGGCRMCVVGVEGSPRPLPACATRVAEGMVVSTNSSVPQFRKTLTEMLLADTPERNGGGRPNELVDLANEYDVEEPFLLPERRIPYGDRNRLMGYDPDACILCNRCVRYTQEVMQCSALSLEGRGPHARIVPTWDRSWLDTECELCGGCLSVCPTGAIHEKFRADAPPDEERALVKTKTTCTFCGVGCQLDLNVDPATNRIVKVTSDPSYVSNQGDLCVKGRFAFNFVHHPDRLTEPLVRGEDGELHETSWEHALEVAAAGLKGVKERHGPQSIGFLASARLTMEENFLIQKLARAVVGTNSVHSCEAT
jgi:predicted molibdopterin-dependent oxidoreductase YjgC